MKLYFFVINIDFRNIQRYDFFSNQSTSFYKLTPPSIQNVDGVSLRKIEGGLFNLCPKVEFL